MSDSLTTRGRWYPSALVRPAIPAQVPEMRLPADLRAVRGTCRHLPACARFRHGGKAIEGREMRLSHPREDRGEFLILVKHGAAP